MPAVAVAVCATEEKKRVQTQKETFLTLEVRFRLVHVCLICNDLCTFYITDQPSCHNCTDLQAINTTLLLLSFLRITTAHTGSGGESENSTCFKTTLTNCDQVFLWLYLLPDGNLTRAEV